VASRRACPRGDEIDALVDVLGGALSAATRRCAPAGAGSTAPDVPRRPAWSPRTASNGAFLGQRGDDLADVADEAHVEHAVGFVEHQARHRVEPHIALAHEIEQPPRRRHQNVDAAGQRLDLRACWLTPPTTTALRM
jgi:hypothetical protein